MSRVDQCNCHYNFWTACHFQQEIVDAMEHVCNLLPQTLVEECTDFVSQYGPVVIKLLLEELAPEAICTALGLCMGDKPQPGE